MSLEQDETAAAAESGCMRVLLEGREQDECGFGLIEEEQHELGSGGWSRFAANAAAGGRRRRWEERRPWMIDGQPDKGELRAFISSSLTGQSVVTEGVSHFSSPVTAEVMMAMTHA
uniref:Uncharacterized protein n=1 Tax=Leersia perrieri TaxID=77586 RepID=A0A0D9XAA8_9ORYZ